MTVDAFYKTAGIKLKSNVYLSGAMQVDLKVKGAQLVRLELNLPSRTLEIFSAETNVYMVTGNGPETLERPIGILLARQNFKQPPSALRNVISNTTCSWPALDRLVGLKMCMDYQFPNVTHEIKSNYFILTGPTLFKLSLNKADPTAKSYLLEYKWERTQVKQQ